MILGSWLEARGPQAPLAAESDDLWRKLGEIKSQFNRLWSRVAIISYTEDVTHHFFSDSMLTVLNSIEIMDSDSVVVRACMEVGAICFPHTTRICFHV